MAIIQNGADISNLMLGTAQIAKVYQGTLIVWSWEVVSVLSGGSSIVYANSLFPNHWDKPNPKRIVVPAGVERGTASALGAIAVMPQGSNPSDSFAGSLTIEISGTVSGIGGALNSGIGGTAFFANFAGRAGQKLILNNYGTIRGGGGGGGRGGNGGTGVWYSGRTATEGPAYQVVAPQYYWEQDTTWGINNVVIAWAGVVKYTHKFGFDSIPASVVGNDGAVYSRGSLGMTGVPEYFSIIRQTTVYDVPNYTSGGVAGNGGRGQGFDGAATAGANAVAGGTNAGASGKSGNGGAYGTAGQTGANGSNGNYSNGLAGAAGGLSGYYLNGAANVTLNNYGTLLGRVA